MRAPPEWIELEGDEWGPVAVALPMAPERTRIRLVARRHDDSAAFDLSHCDGTLQTYPASALEALLRAHRLRTEHASVACPNCSRGGALVNLWRDRPDAKCWLCGGSRRALTTAERLRREGRP